jgi:riboflavin kinase/FMN adenylyltransferase
MTLLDALTTAGIAGPSVVTIGTFDGVHLGHQHLVQTVARQARERKAVAVVLTFQPRPIEILKPEIPSSYLCSLETRIRLLRQAGADVVVPVTFTRELSLMSAFDFANVLVRYASMCMLVGGPDLAIGHGRQGTPEVLREIGSRLHFEVMVVPVHNIDGEPVRSSAVRRAITDGEVRRAAKLLGRNYALDGVVVHGDGRGRTIGVPTANVAVEDRLTLPGDGIYAVYFHFGGQRWPAAASIGVRPTFNGTGRSLEVHLLDFDGDLYGRRCEVEFVERLRPEERFESVEDLVRQIQQDIQLTREILRDR